MDFQSGLFGLFGDDGFGFAVFDFEAADDFIFAVEDDPSASEVAADFGFFADGEGGVFGGEGVVELEWFVGVV